MQKRPWRYLRGALLAVCLGALYPSPADSELPRVDDPLAEGWGSEAFAASADRQLKALGKTLSNSGHVAAEELENLVSPRFDGGTLKPGRLVTVFDDSAIRVLRPEATAVADGGARFRGPDGFSRALDQLMASFAHTPTLHTEFKTVRVIQSPAGTRTRHLVSIAGTGTDGSVEVHMGWKIEWDEGGRLAPPRLLSVELTDYEEVRFSGSTPTLFSDATASVLEGNPSFEEQILRGPSYWLGRLEAGLGTDFMGHSGLAVGDVDGDGLDDLYVLQQGGLPNRLYVQSPDGTAVDRSEWARLDFLDRSLSALLVDLDGDGDQDLVVGTTAGLLLLANDGSGRFDDRAVLSTIRYAYSLAASDYDLDGDLDLYVSRYGPLREDPVEAALDIPKPIPYHDAQNGAPNFLLRNDGDWRFTDATVETGLDHDNRRWSFAAAWEDFDNDGDPDLYVANDFGRNCLYRNDDGRFTNVAAHAGVEDVGSGMSVAWADYDQDGLMDLYIGNMFSSAGNRIATQPRFQSGASENIRTLFRRLAKGNTLFRNLGHGRFREVSDEAAVTMGRWAWSSVFADINNDGTQDLVVSNGYLTGENPDDL